MKQVIAVRTDLKIGKGKIAAQVAHASLAAAEEAMRSKPGWFESWKDGGQAKIVVKASDEGQLRDLFKKARSAHLPCAIIEDAGLTQLEPGTPTCVGIGPASDDSIDKITGNLKLL
ncbi:MAG: peptidyl-tRNA hydrolase Pth2 [Thaumarchaeota archaeon]|nr:peptidyl-tRNA hydrolase Pth2 [Nitrososphaerota archaeon]